MLHPVMKAISLLSGVLLSVLPATGQDLNANHPPVEIKFRYQAGKTYETKMVTQSSTKMNMRPLRASSMMS